MYLCVCMPRSIRRILPITYFGPALFIDLVSTNVTAKTIQEKNEEISRENLVPHPKISFATCDLRFATNYNWHWNNFLSIIHKLFLVIKVINKRNGFFIWIGTLVILFFSKNPIWNAWIIGRFPLQHNHYVFQTNLLFTNSISLINYSIWIHIVSCILLPKKNYTISYESTIPK